MAKCVHCGYMNSAFDACMREFMCYRCNEINNNIPTKKIPNIADVLLEATRRNEERRPNTEKDQ